MDYWISSKNVRTGPHSLEQLESMWDQGKFTSDTFYYENLRAEWLPLKSLVESKRELFTVEEAFVRLGQSRQKGCLLVFNAEEYLHLYVDGGFVVSVIGRTDKGEMALARALEMENTSYKWFADITAPVADLRVNVQEYALKNAIARDVRLSSQSSRKKNTVALPKVLIDKLEAPLKFHYFLVPREAPTMQLKLVKMTSVAGREDHCDVVIDDSQVSRRHCLLESSEQYVKVKDLGSSNGTFINGLPIRDGFLNVKDQLSLGGYELTLLKEQKRAPEYDG